MTSFAAAGTATVLTAPPAPTRFVPDWPGANLAAASIEPRSQGRMLSGKAFVLTLIAIGVGILGSVVSYALSRDNSIEVATYIRYVTVVTLAVYVVVGLLIVTQVTPSVRLRWREGSPVRAVAIGLVSGVVPSLLLLAIVSSAAGHLSPDPRIVLMMSEGDAPHIVAALLISCAAAPLIEEVLFRGLLLESLRQHGNAAAILISATAFAVWHLHVVSLVYYTLMGSAFGLLYVRRGLFSSMAAHVGFNGVLSVAAIVVVLGGGGTVSANGLTVQLPRGWSSQSVAGLPVVGRDARPAMLFKGPSASTVAVLAIPTPNAPDVQRLETLLSSPQYGGQFPGIETGSIREATVPAGTVVEIDAIENGEHGTLALLPHAGTTYEFVFRSAGSAKAEADFPRILRGLRVN